MATGSRPAINQVGTTAPAPLGQCVLRAVEGLKLDPGDRMEGHATFVYDFQPTRRADGLPLLSWPPSDDGAGERGLSGRFGRKAHGDDGAGSASQDRLGHAAEE